MFGCFSQVKNVSGDMLDGKVGRIYMPKQDLEGLALRKMKVRASFCAASAWPLLSFCRPAESLAPDRHCTPVKNSCLSNSTSRLGEAMDLAQLSGWTFLWAC